MRSGAWGGLSTTGRTRRDGGHARSTACPASAQPPLALPAVPASRLPPSPLVSWRRPPRPRPRPPPLQRAQWAAGQRALGAWLGARGGGQTRVLGSPAPMREPRGGRARARLDGGVCGARTSAGPAHRRGGRGLHPLRATGPPSLSFQRARAPRAGRCHAAPAAAGPGPAGLHRAPATPQAPEDGCAHLRPSRALAARRPQGEAAAPSAAGSAAVPLLALGHPEEAPRAPRPRPSSSVRPGSGWRRPQPLGDHGHRCLGARA